jgi:hypothetical protein
MFMRIMSYICIFTGLTNLMFQKPQTMLDSVRKPHQL